ncbi:MAG: tripartite tricarboxylate transporter substrate binding protein [Proteobacteria bacterium]|nr:tripartite tricarboxylate transporter substrate binding protein [Pseudomonadota bacterium]
MQAISARAIISLAAAAGTALTVWAVPAKAEFPEKPVEMTILFGSTAKTIAQVLSSEMSKHLGKPVVPVDRTGGGGSVGYSHVKGSAADGYSIVWNSNSISTAHYQGNMTLGYKDFAPIALISVESPAVAVRANSGWKTLQDIAKAAKAGSGKLKVGHSGNGSFTHVVAAAIFNQLGVGDRIIYVPYDAGKAPTELLGGRIDVAVQWPGQFISHMQAGTVNLVAVTGSERVNQVKTVPTAKEQGVDVELTMWRGLAAPAGTPVPVLKKLEAAAKMVADSTQFKATLEKLGAEVNFKPADEFAKLIVKDDVRLGKIMGELGLRKEPKS